MKTGSVDDDYGKISISQSASDLKSQKSDLEVLDDNTKLITNYIDAIDRNKGNKNTYARYKTSLDGKYNYMYNEAFDGVSVLVTTYTYDIGFSANSGHRTNVLDPLLVGHASSKSDLYNFDDEDKVRSSVYLTSLRSSSTELGNTGYLGTLKGLGGMGDLELCLDDIYELAYTKTFYIPNATVSDLN